MVQIESRPDPEHGAAARHIVERNHAPDERERCSWRVLRNEGPIARIIAATLGAVILLLILRLVRGRGRW